MTVRRTWAGEPGDDRVLAAMTGRTIAAIRRSVRLDPLDPDEHFIITLDDGTEVRTVGHWSCDTGFEIDDPRSPG